MSFHFSPNTVAQPATRLRRWMTALKSSAAHVVPRRGRAPQLVLDPLEPRLMLNADVLALDLPSYDPSRQDHDLLVRLVEDIKIVENQSVAVQRVEIVDRADPSQVLAAAEFDGISRIAILGGAGDDRITIDTDSFAGFDAPSIVFAGGDGVDTLSLIGSAASDWHLDGQSGGAIFGPLHVEFSGVERLEAGSGTDTLHGSVSDTDWLVDGDGAGRIGALVFDGFENLVGNADNTDVFTFTQSGRLAGFIDGGAGGYDSLVLDTGVVQSLVAVAFAPDAGLLTYDGNLLIYKGLEPVTVIGTQADVTFNIDTLAGGQGDNVIRLLYDTNAGMMLLDSVNGQFEDHWFNAPTNSLTIIGGSGTDDITILSLSPGFDASLIVNMLSDGYDPFNTGGILPGNNNLTTKSVIRVSGDIALNGNALQLSANTILVGTVAEQTGSTGSWAANQTFTNVNGSGGSGSGMRAVLTTDADGNVTARITQAGTGYANGDQVTFSLSGGRSVTVKLINAADSAIISTQKAGGNAGDILFGFKKNNSTFGGQEIYLGPNAQLLAEADTAAGLKPGKITLATTDIAFRAASWPFDFTNKSAFIEINGATIKGGAISITAKATDTNAANEESVPSFLRGFVGNLTNLLNQIPGALISAFTGVDISVVMRGADAKIHVYDATIVSAASVDISASTKVDTQVYALAMGMAGLAANSGFEFAAGYGLAQSSVEVIISGTTSITADDNVRITASGDTTTRTVARASSNLLTPTVDPNATSLAVAIAHTELNVLARVGAAATIVARNGNVNVNATGKTKQTADASTVGFVDGRAGVGVGLSFDFSSVVAELDGDITAKGTPAGGDGPKFDGSSGSVVNLATDTIYVPDHGLTNGQLITYTALDGGAVTNPVSGDPLVVTAGTAIGGLKDKGTYYVIVVDENHVQLANAPVLDLDASGTDATATHTIQVPAAKIFDLDAIDSGADTIRFADHGFETGDQVTYIAGGTGTIAGLVNSGVYTVEKVEDLLFKLKDGNGNVVQIAQGAALGIHSFTKGSTVVSLNLARIDAATDRISMHNHGFTADTLVNYASLADDGAGSIGGLVNEAEYLLRVVDANTFELYDVTTGQKMDIGAAAGGAAHALAYIASVKNINPTTAVDGNTDTITIADHGLADGQAIIYGTDPTKTRSQTITQPDGQVLQLEIADREIGGLMNGGIYYVVKVDDNRFRLVEDPLDVKSVKAIDLTSLGSGNYHALADDGLTNGIGVKASLVSDTRTLVKPEVGGKFNPSKYKDVLSRGDIALASIFGNASASSGKQTVKDQNGKDVTSSIQNDSLSAAGAVGVNVVAHDVRAVVGERATSADKTKLQTQGNIEVLASIEHKTQLNVQGSVSKPKGSQGAAVSISIGVGVYNNDTQAIIRGNTQLDAYGTIKVDSQLTYPFLTKPEDLLFGIPQDIVNRGVSAITTLLDGTFGVSTKLMNNWVLSYAKATESPAASVSGSIAVNVFTNTSKALVQSGAEINQKPISATWQPPATQSVVVNAYTMMQLIEMVGIGKWSLNEGPLGKARYESKTAAQLRKGGDIVDVAGRSGSKALGGSILVDAIDSTTHARIEGGAKVSTGASGSLTISAKEDILRVAISQSGGQTDDNGQFAFAGSGLGLRQRSDVQAGIVATDSAGPAIGGGALTITAETGGVQVGVAGSLVLGGSGSSGLGLSVMVADIERKVYAFVGADPSIDAHATPNGAVSLNVGAMTVKATTGGTIVSVVGTAVALTSQGPVPDSPDDALDGASLPGLFGEASNVKSGIGIAGSAGVNVIADTTLAYINARGVVTASTIALEAENDQVIVSVTGGVAISKSGGTQGGGGTVVGGAFSLNQLTADTRALIVNKLAPTGTNGLTVTATAADGNGDELLLSAKRDGTVVSFSAAISANMNTGTANAFAGSVSINRLVDITQALVDGAAIVAADARLRARNEPVVVAIGGGASYTAGGKGIGASLGYNQLSAQTKAGIFGTARGASATLSDDLNIEAVNDQNLTAIGISAGISSGGGGVGGAFTLGINIISTDERIFTRDNAGEILAGIENATVTTPGGVWLTAQDDSAIQAVAGALGIGTQGAGFGAGLGWNQIALKVRATIDSASVTAGNEGVNLSALSTDQNAVPAGKIAAAAVGASGSGGSGVAVGVSASVNGILNTIEASVVDNATVTVNGTGSLRLRADDDSTIRTFTGGVAISTGSGVGAGAAAGGNYVANTVTAKIDSSTVNAGGEVTVTADQKAVIQTMTLGLAGGTGGGNAGAGSLSVNVVTNDVTAAIDGISNVRAADDVRVLAKNSANVVAIAGGVAGGSQVAVGIAATNVTVVNTTKAFIDGRSTVAADGSGADFDDILGKTRSGVSVEALSDGSIMIVAAGGAASTSAGAGAGAITVTFIDDTVQSFIEAPGGNAPSTAGISSLDDVNIVARGTLSLVGVAGTIAGASSVGIGIGADAGVVKRKVEAYVGNAAKVSAGDNVIVDASGDLDLVSVSASGAFAGTGAGTLTAGVTVLDLTTRAYIGSGAVVHSDGNVVVQALDDTTVDQISANISGAGTGAVGVAAGVGVMNKTTEAYIDSDAQVTALAAAGKAGIAAYTGELVDALGFLGAGVSGSTITISGHGLMTGDQVFYNSPNPLQGLADGTRYYVIRVSDNEIRLASSLVNAALGNALTLGPGGGASMFDVHVLRKINLEKSGGSKDFASADVNYATNRINAAGHAFTTGEEIIYTAESIGIGGLVSGQRYYVIRYSNDSFGLAATRSAAHAGTAIDLTNNGVSADARHLVQSLTGTGVPDIANDEFDDSALAAKGDRRALEAVQKGLIVAAVSLNDMTSAGVGVAISGKGSGALAGTVAVHTIDTRAFIAQGAKINQDNTGAGADQNVRVAAVRSYDGLAIGGGLAGAGIFAAAPAVAAPKLAGETMAYIQGRSSGAYDTVVNVAGDLAVQARAEANIISIAAGLAFSGTVSIAGSGAVVLIDTDTIASISGRVRVNAGGNVLVGASDDTTSHAIAGAVGIGLAGGGGAGAVNVTQIEKTTAAIIGVDAIVDANGLGAALIGSVPTGAFAGNGYGLHAIRGVAVVAQSSEKVVAVSASAGGGLYAGIAGAVSVELIDSDTFAAIGDGAAINMNTAGTAHPAQSVTVSARNTVDILAISGALGGGAAGIGGSFDVGLIRNDTQALIGAAQLRARDDVDVSALSRWKIDSNAIAVGAGLAGIGGGVVVYTIGGNFSDSYGGGGQSASALEGEDGDTVTAFVDNTISAMMSAMQTGDEGASSDPALPVFNPATAVNTSTDTITLGADTGLNTGDSVVYSANGNSAIGGLEDGKVYFVIVDPAQPQRIKLAATHEDAVAGCAIDLTGGATGSNHRLSASSAQIGEIARQSSARNTPSVSGALSATGIRASGTTAAIESGAAIVAGDIDVVARQQLDFTTRGGGVGAGAGALGVGIVVLDIDVDTTSYIAPNVTLTGLYPANSSLSVTASLDSDIRALGFGGAVSGFVSLGGAVAYVTDNSSARALLGARPGSATDDTQLSHAQSASSATQITGFTTVTVDADATIDHYVMNAAAAVSGIAGLGAAIVFSKIDGNVQAVIGDFTALGTTTGIVGDTTGFIGGLTVDANRTIGLHPFTAGAPFGIAIGGGILGVAAGIADITVAGEVTARLGNRASVYAAGDVDILATDTVDTNNIKVDGGAVGGIAVGIVIAHTTITPKTTASIGSRTILQSRSLDVKANSTTTGGMQAEAAGGGVLSGQGLDVVMTVKPQTKAEIGSDAALTTSQALAVTSTANTTARMEAKAGNHGGITVIIGKAKGVLENTNSVVIGDNARMTAGTAMTALAASTNTGWVEADGGGGALVAISQAETDLEMKDTTKTLIGAGAQLTAATNLGVESRTSSTGDSRAIALAQGLGANTKTDAAILYSSVTETEIGAGAQLRATGILDVIARVSKLDLDAYAESDADAAGADADADATIDPFAGQRSTDVGVIVRAGAKLLGDTQTNLKARQENLHSLAKADSDTDGVGGDTNATAINNFNAATRVLTEAGSEIRTRALYVEAEGGAHGASANAIRSGALIDGGSATQNTVVTFPRTIVFNSNVFLYGPANPELEIGAAGNIVKQVGITPVITASEIVIPDIIYQSTAAGSATFSISQSSLDPNPAGYGTSPAENSIEGNATFTFVTGFDRITITNHSDRHLRIGSIDPYIQNPNFIGNLTVNVTEKSRFLPVTSSDPGSTRIEIVNTNLVSAPDIRLTKLINNRFGTTLIEAAGGDILTWASAGAIRSTTLELIAGGVIGVNGAAIATESTLLRARAGFGIVLVETGDLEIDTVRTTTGLVDLTATGSILDGNATDATNVAGPSIKLTANSGAIGLPDAMLRIDAARVAGALVANAQTGIAVIDDNGGLGIGTARSVTGDVTLQTRDTVLIGEDILIGTGGLVQAVAGNVNIFSGDGFFLDAAAIVAAAGSVVLRGDHGNVDAGIGTRMDLRGRITGTSITIAGEADADSIALRRVMFGAPVTIQSGGGQDAIWIGSQATADTNSGGSLSTIEDTLTVDAGSEQDVLFLDDSGSGQARSVVVKNGEITLSGVNGAIRFANTDTVALTLGDRSDTILLQSSAADMRIDIDAGGGNDTFIFRGTDNTLNAIDGLVIARGGAGNNTMRVIDSGDAAANAGLLGGGNNNQIFGFGMGSADQTAIVETAGITYGDIQELTVELGSGAGAVAVEGISTKTTLKTGAGANSVTVGGALSRIAGDLLVQGDAADNFVIFTDTGADLTLTQVAAGRGLVTGIGMPGSIAFEGMPDVTIRLSNDDDRLRIVGTAMPVLVDARGGNDTIVVENAAHATAFDLGDGDDLITVYQVAAAMVVTGDATGGGTDRLIVERSATTAAVNARIEDGAEGGEGVVSGMTAASITFRDMDRVDVRAGSGNDVISIDVSNDMLPATVIAVHGGAGDDLILAQSISLAPTIVDGGTENDTLKIVIPGLPDGQQFLALQKTVETLIVDNSQNDLGAVAWVLDGVVLKAGNMDIVTTEGADVTRILGGQTGDDTLTVRSVTSANVTGMIDGDRIELRSGLVIVTQADPAKDFDKYRNYEGVIGFDKAVAGGANYIENGFSLSTSNAAGFLRSDAISPAVAARAANDLFTLRSANADGTPTGNGFALYSLELANTGTTDQVVTISGLTVTGHVVSQDLLVKAGAGFQRYDIDAVFTVLSQVTLTPGADILVDNIVARDVLTNAGAGPVQIVPVYTLHPTGGDIVFNTATRTISGANILVDYNGIPGTDATLLAGTVFGSSANLGITAVTTNGLTVFTFPGDLIIPDGVTVRVTGANALSINVGDDVFIGANVTINVSATSQNGVGGGGSGGAQQTGGSGGSGGSAPQGGGNGGGPSTVTRAPSGQGGAAGQGDVNGGSGGSGLTGRGGAQGGGGGGGGGVDYSTFLGAITSYTTWTGGPGGFGGTGNSGNWGNTGNRGAAGYGNFYSGNDAIGGSAGSNGGGGGGGSGGGVGNASAGTAGDPGTPGGDAGDGAGGNNNTTGTGISGGMGGGSGGGGGGGGAGGGGGGGGGGRGAYWESGLNQYVQGGGGGGGGGSGGRGGTGGYGGAGGAGGGAIEIIAAGRVTIGTSTQLLSQGADGSSGTDGLNNQLTGGAGGTGGSARNSGANGAPGGNGANGGSGGDGGGGSGGTIKIFATDVNAGGASVDTSGGQGAGNAGDGGIGRFLIGRNTGVTGNDGRPTTITNARLEAFTGQIAGLGEANRYLNGDGWTANIAGLKGGADIYGIIDGLSAADIDYDSVAAGVQQAPSGALLAVMRFEFGLGGANEDYTGYDMLVIVNLTNVGLSGITLGVNEAGQALRVDGLGVDAVLSSLPAGAVWATLIPESAQNFNVSLAGFGSLTNATINDGGVQYISATRPPLNVAAAIGGLDAVAASADGNHIYAVNTAQDALIVINAADGSQRQLFKQGEDGVTGLDGASAVVVAGNYVLVSSTVSNQIAVFERDAATGNLTFKSIGASGGNVYAELRYDSATNTVTASGAGGVRQFSLNNATGALTQTAAYTAAGTDQVVAKGSQLFVADRANDTLRVVDAATGQITQTISGFGLGLDGASDLALSPDGNTLYVTGRDGNSLAVFAVGTGPQPLQHIQTIRDGLDGVRGLAGPTDVAVTPDGNYVLVTGSAGNAITVFQRNAATGELLYVQTVRNNVGGIAGLGTPTAMTFGPWSAGADTMKVYVGSSGANGEVGGLAVFDIDLGPQPDPIAFVTEHENIERVTVELQGGDDTFAIRSAPSAVVTSTTIRTGDGEDIMVVDDFGANTVIELGAGNDRADLRATTAGQTIAVYGGEGNDTLVMQSGGPGAITLLYGGSGEDRIVIQSVGAQSTTEVFGGDGADTVRISGANLPASATLIAHGDEPNPANPADGGDTLIFDPGSYSFLPAFPDPRQGTIGVPGFGTVVYDTFEGVRIMSAPSIAFNPINVIREGDGITIEVQVAANGTTGLLKDGVLFDIDGDGRFGEAIGIRVGNSDIYRVTLTWAQLVGLGLSDNGGYRISVSATNEDDLTTTVSAIVTITDTPPVVNVSGSGQGYVGEAYVIDFSALDPSPNDRVLEWRIDWGDGTIETFGAGTLFAAHVYASPRNYQIRVGAIDKDTAPNPAWSAPHHVAIGVRANQVRIDGPYTIVEGQSLTVGGSAAGSPLSVLWDIDGDGQFDDASGFQAALTWAQLGAMTNPIVDSSPTPFTIAMRVIYADGSMHDQTTTLTVLNADPSFTDFVNNGPVDEGAAAVVTFIGATDPSAPDAANLRYSFDFDNDGIFEIVDSVLGSVVVPGQYLTQSGLVTIRGVITDDDGGMVEGFTTIEVREVAPTLFVSGASSVNEGSVYTLQLSSYDPGNDVITRWVVDWGDGNIVGYDATAGITQVSYVYADDGVRTIKVGAIDNDGIYQAADKIVTVMNVAPVLSDLATTAISENGVTRLTGRMFDVGALDSFILSINWGDGSAIQHLAFTPGTTVFDIAHQYLQDSAGQPGGVYTVTVTLSDDDGGTDQGTTTAAVANIAPVVTGLSLDPAIVLEGGKVILTGTYTDAGSLDTHVVEIDWGDGNVSYAIVDALTRSFTATHIYNDTVLPNNVTDTFTITARVYDEQNASDSATIDVVMLNVAPELGPLALNGVPAIPPSTGIAPAPSTITIDENGVVHVEGFFVDPGLADLHTVTIAWGDGTFSLAAVTTDPTDPRVRHYSASHRYLDDDPTATLQDDYEIVITVRDDAGAQSSTRATITVANVDPVVVHVALDQVSIDENDVATIRGVVTDIGTLDTHVVEIDWGDGTTSVVVVDPATGMFVASHRYLDDNPSGTPVDRYTITVVAVDDDGGRSAPKTTDVEVRNVAPDNLVITVAKPSIAYGQRAVVTGSFTDIGSLDTHVVLVHWGDGKVTQALVDPLTRTFTASHHYIVPPGTAHTFQITVSVTDDDSGVVTGTAQVKVTRSADPAIAESVAAFAPVATAGLASPPLDAMVQAAGIPDTATEGGVVLSGSGLPQDITGSAGARLVVDEGRELRLPQSYLDDLPGNARVTIDWGDGHVQRYGSAEERSRIAHVYRNDSGAGTYRLLLTVTEENGMQRVTAFDVTVRNVAPSVQDVLVRSEAGPDGDRIVVTGAVVDPGLDDTHVVLITWSDGSVTQAVIGRDRSFATWRSVSEAGLTPVEIRVIDTADPASQMRMPMNGMRASDPAPQKRGALPQPERHAAVTAQTGIDVQEPIAIAFGAGLAGLRVSGRPKLSRRAEAPMDVPDGWHVVGDAAGPRTTALADNEDNWLVLDGDAYWMRIAAE